MTAKVQLITTHGIFELTPLMDETVLELLHRHQVPWTSISAYIKNCEDNSYKIFPCLEQRVQDFPNGVTLGLFYQRNINPMTYTRTNMEVSAVGNGEDAVTEYLYRDMKNGAKAPTVIKKFSVTECRAIVTQRVHEMLDAHLPDSDVPVKIIVGVSGGGDSNALISAMSRYQSKKIELHPVIVCGPGEWDSGIPRAKEICNDLGLELAVIGEKETREILGAVPEGAPLIDRFTKVFPDEDYEFFGTLLIRLALSYVAADREADYICTGLNFEDLLAEVFARLLGGTAPLPMPVRQIGELKLIYPLWQLPKKIIDGCFPKYSYDNYQERYPSHSEGRTLFYHLAYWIAAEFPQVGEKLLQTASGTASQNGYEFPFDEEFGFEMLGPIPLPLREKFRKLLTGNKTLTHP